MQLNLRYCLRKSIYCLLFLVVIYVSDSCAKKPGSDPPPNQLPTANAGSDQAITLPTNQVSLAGTGTDNDGTIASYAWTKVSGPAGETISTASSASTTVTGLVTGVYVFKLTVTDNKGATGSDNVQVTVSTPAGNMPPSANAGTDQTITLPTNQASLSGTGTDTDGTIASYAWTKVSGPAGETITTPSSANTTVTGLVVGIYVFRLTVTDNNNATGTDDIQITVNAAPNIPPVANAGTDQTIVLPINQVSLNGSGTDADGTIASYSWSKTSGPAGETITSPTSANTTVTGLVAGTYVFNLAVLDNMGAPGSDNVQVTVNNPPPTATSFDLFVSSQNTNSVKRYNGVSGAYLGNFVAPGSGGLSATQEVKFGLDGHLYVTGYYTPNILRFDSTNGNLLGQFSNGYAMENPTKMSFGPDGRIYVSQWGNAKNAVVRFNATTGAFIDEFTPPLGAGNGMGHAWDAQGRLYVACFASKDVKRFNTSGQLIDIFIPTAAGQLQGPVNLWFDNNNNLFVVDWQAGNIKKYNATSGAFISVFISGLSNCEGFTFDKSGNIYICNYSANAINKYDANGNFIGVFATGGGLNVPNSVVFGPSQ